MSDNSSPEIAHHKSVSAHQKVRAVLRLLEGANTEELARELGVSTERLRRWKQQFIEGGRANLLQRRDHGSERWRARRKKILQWAVLVIGLVAMIWAVTRFFGSSAPGGG